ncbi:hypothetical protein BRETT_004985 [Brettanomyces bruxellensis]|uniref:Phosphoribulokinase/uridine kinase domain-containing protein n=1 Tax=Dekkera bruxellensis TaxID=5007 RepID=A0A871RE08_DEKBR|nr:uncharacterized protein BRETT_004985 [Brettanomyces bruxellensis]QOU20330.1 hypothetical protein BRETT_004985 [Brettanomyces bruxellensis]
MTTYEKTIKFLTPFLAAKSINPSSGKPFFLGIEGPQGSGKTTLSRTLAKEIPRLYPKLKVIAFSMDDFYLTYEKQNKLANQNPDNILLSGRFLGTHDLDLLNKCMTRLSKENDGVDIPVYDKSKHDGKGDRLPFMNWTHIVGPVDVVIFEGWFNGYRSYKESSDVLKQWKVLKFQHPIACEGISDNNIVRLNQDLAEYECIWKFFDAFVGITTDNIENVYKWRLQQEHDLIKSAGSGMTDKEVHRFVDRYMPGYWLFYGSLGLTMKQFPSINVCIDEKRNVIRCSSRSHL